MALFDSIRLGSSAAGDYEIERSLRFNDDDSPRLTRTLASDGNRRKWTWSCWFKPSNLGATQVFLLSQRSSSDNQCHIMLSSDKVDFESGGGKGRVQTNAVFRDVSAWYHLVLHLDSDNSTANDRVKIYINGVQQAVTISTTVATGDHGMNNNNQQQIGAQASTNDLFYDGYLAEVNFIDGQAYDPSYFAETDALTGQWNPKKYAGSYGSQGFYLNFSDNSGTTATTLGKDYSGNGNNFTPNNFSVASGKEGDSFADTPTNNFCTFNVLVNSNTTQSLSDGGLTRAGGAQKCVGTFVLENNKYYFEYKAEDSNGNHCVGVTQADADLRSRINTQTASCFASNGEFKIESGSQTSGFVSWGNGDIVQVAIDTTLGTPKVWFGVNNSWQGASGSSGSFDASGGYSLTAGKKYVFNVDHGSNSGSTTGTAFFGAHQGGFNYDPPTGFVAASQANLPDPTIKLPNKHFGTILYTGNDADNRNVTDSSAIDFTPDWVWHKTRNATNYNFLFDSVRGATKILVSNTGDAEATQADSLSAFITNGFTVSDNTANADMNSSSHTYVAWNWKGGGTASSNSDGSLTSSVSANTSAGFSIVSYTGNGSTGTVGHGLGVAPDFYIVKERTDTSHWYIYSKALGATKTIRLNENFASATDDIWQDTAPSSTVFYLSQDTATNQSSQTYIAYCFSEVAGYSKFGSYTGNGSSDGTFVFTGFRPAVIIVKRSSATQNWLIFDNKRGAYNPDSPLLYPNLSNAEDANTMVDFVSNGFKWRAGNLGGNDSGDTFIYLAFAETPFKYSRAR